MVQVLFKVIVSILVNLVRIILFPINSIVISTLPDLSNKITEVSTNISNVLFNSLSWALGVVPSVVITTLLFILSVEIARHTIFISTHVITLVIDIVKRIKFW